jgi:ABC-type nitrate/sulfonate/bicarbonate transport system substrate-binding protein
MSERGTAARSLARAAGGGLTRRALLRTAALAVLFGQTGALSGGSSAAVTAAPARVLKVTVFPGGRNLPLWVAEEKGFFAANDLTVQIALAPSSVDQLTRLIAGDVDIALTAVDNVIAYDEGQGEVPVTGRPDLFAFMGGDNGLLRLMVKPEIRTYADLKGQRLSVDALTTGYALVLRKMLGVNALRPDEYTLVAAGGTAQRWQALLKGEHAGTLLITPFEVLAHDKGFRLLGNAIDVLHRYQGTVGAARRAWAEAHHQELVDFIRAYRNALTWLYTPANREDGVQVLARNASLPPNLAREAFGILVDPVDGFAPAATPDMEGIRTVLALRSQYAAGGKALGSPLKYVDLRYYSQ